MATKYSFTDQTKDVFERIIQVNNNDYNFLFQHITINEYIDDAFDYWNCKITNNDGEVLSNKPVVYNCPIFIFTKPSDLNGNFIFIQNNTTEQQPSGSDFADGKVQLLYYEDSEIE